MMAAAMDSQAKRVNEDRAIETAGPVFIILQKKATVIPVFGWDKTFLIILSRKTRMVIPAAGARD